MDKKYLAIWGSWDANAAHVYPVAYKEVGFIFFQENEGGSGYSLFDLGFIEELEIGHNWKSEYGNHYIIRIA